MPQTTVSCDSPADPQAFESEHANGPADIEEL